VKILNNIKTYKIFSIVVIKQNYLAYKSRFILWVIANSITVIAQIFLWIAIFNSSITELINGISKQEMINYIIISKIIESLTFASLESKVSQDYNDGRIAMSLIKPINYRTELLFRTFGGTLGSAILFCPIYLVIFVIFNIGSFGVLNLQFINIIYFIVLLIIAFFINYFISIIFSSLIFKTIKSSGIYEVKKTLIKLLSGALFPLVFYPEILAKILKYLPFVYLRYIPTLMIQGNYNNSEGLILISIGLLWLALLYIISRLMWIVQIKKITIYGG